MTEELAEPHRFGQPPMSFTTSRVCRLAGADRDRFAAVYETSFPPGERDDTGELVLAHAAVSVVVPGWSRRIVR